MVARISLRERRRMAARNARARIHAQLRAEVEEDRLIASYAALNDGPEPAPYTPPDPDKAERRRKNRLDYARGFN